MSFKFRPALELLDARELPAVVMKDLLVSSVVATKPPAENALAVVQLAPAQDQPLRTTYDLKLAKKL